MPLENSQELNGEDKFIEALASLLSALIKIVEDLQYYHDQTSTKRYFLGSWLETNSAKWLESLEWQYQLLSKLGANINYLVIKQIGGEELNRDETRWRKVWLQSLKMNIDDVEKLSKDLFDVKVSSKLLPSHSSMEEKEQRAINDENEALITSNLSHFSHHIFKCYGFAREHMNVKLITEVAPYGALYPSVLTQFGRQKKDAMLMSNLYIAWFCDLICAIDFIHSRGIIHKSIRGESLQVMDNFYLKLADLSACSGNNEGILKVAPPSAPFEKVKAETPFEPPDANVETRAADIFSFGVTIIQILTNKMPSRVIGAAHDQLEKALNVLEIPGSKYSKVIPALLLKCVDEDPEKRPTTAYLKRKLQKLLRYLGGDIRKDPESIKMLGAKIRDVNGNLFGDLSLSGFSLLPSASSLSSSSGICKQMIGGKGSKLDYLSKVDALVSTTGSRERDWFSSLLSYVPLFCNIFVEPVDTCVSPYVDYIERESSTCVETTGYYCLSGPFIEENYDQYYLHRTAICSGHCCYIHEDLNAILSILKNGPKDEKIKSVRYITQIARESKTKRVDMGKMGFPNYLIELLGSIECNEEDKASIAEALAELACNTQNKIIMAENDVLDLLIDLLDSRNERCKGLVACALASLVFSELEGAAGPTATSNEARAVNIVCAQIRASIVRGNGIQKLVDILKTSTQDSTKEQAAFALFCLSYNAPISNRHQYDIYKTAIAKSNGVDVIIDQLKRASNGVKEKVFAVFISLCTLYETQVIVSECGGVRVVLDVLNSWWTSAACKKQATIALYALAIHNVENQVNIGKNGGIEYLLRVLKKRPIRECPHHYAMVTLYLLAKASPENKMKIIRANGWEILRDLVRDGNCLKDSIHFITHTIYSAGYNFDVCRDIDLWNHESTEDAGGSADITSKMNVRDIGVKILKTIEI